MSLEFVDGFDHYQSLTQKWDAIIFSGLTVDQPQITQNGRNGGCLAMVAGGTGVTQGVQKNLPNVATRFCGFALYSAPVTGSSVQLCGFYDGVTDQVDLRLNSGGHFLFTRNGTLLGAAST